MAETLTLYKLIILCMLDKVDFPLSNAQISEFILEKEYTDYFTVQQAVSGLLDAGLIRLQTLRSTSLYRITPEGENTLSYFGNKISSAIREDIDSFLAQHKLTLRNAHSTPADYYRTPSGGFAARCRVLEKDSALIDLTLTLPTRQQAEAVCGHWKEKSQELYAAIMSALL